MQSCGCMIAMLIEAMAKQQKQNKKQPIPAKKTAEAISKNKRPAKPGVLEMLDGWLEKNDRKIFYALLFLSTALSLLLFDSKVSIGGDDSGYMERAWFFLHEGQFPLYQGPGYPVFLSLFVKLSGLNVIVLKMSSVLCQFGFVWCTYLAFRKRVPYTVLFGLLAFCSLNYFILYYASQTYTETFFLFIQSICLFVFFKIMDTINRETNFIDGLKQHYLKWIVFGLMFLLLSVSKSIAVVSIAAVLFYLVLNKNFKQAVYAIAAFALVRLVYELVVISIYGQHASGQLEMSLRKDLYKPELGHEDFTGLVNRAINNFNTYFSLHTYRILNLRDFDTLKVIPGLAFFTGIVLVVLSILSYRRNKYIFFSSIYLFAFCGAIFFGIQANNMQDRLIIIVMPLIFVLLFYGGYILSKPARIFQYVFILFSSVMLLITVGKSAMKANKNLEALKKNLSGDIYYGYTPDWINYLTLSKWCADSLPKDAFVMVRKPEMSFIASRGKKFYGIYQVPSVDPDTVLQIMKQNKITHTLIANLRRDPKKNDGYIINTIQRMIVPLSQKYPQKLRLVKRMGDDEPAELYEIVYDK